MQDAIVDHVLKAIDKAALVIIEVSARHVHLSKTDMARLFGDGVEMIPKRPLSQPGQFLADQRVNLIGPKGKFTRVALLGPARSETQVELSRSDAVTLGVEAPLRLSGQLENSGQVTIEGPKGSITIPKGVICAKRHVHVTPEVAARHGWKDKQIVCVETLTDRPVIFKDVVLRVTETSKYRMHIDFDEANAANVQGFVLGKIIA
ncbi:MAG: phosphate propanoyltransferase [Synergistaceae bacterium]|nr:phosphate propanoyltransferase [Candidatus Equadaptatus faecalis]